jgi:hypothetical protein
MSGLYMCVACINKSIDKVVAPEHPASSCNHSSRPVPYNDVHHFNASHDYQPYHQRIHNRLQTPK